MREHDGLVFTIDEYRRRLGRVRERMAKAELDALLVTGPENITYLTSYQTTGYYYMQALVIPLEDEPFMVTRLLENTSVTTRTWIEHSFPYTDTEDAMGKLVVTMKERNLGTKRIGYDRNGYFLRAFEQDALHDGLPDATLVDTSGLVEAERVIKSDEEIALLRRVARVTEVAMQAGVDAVAAGVTENHIAAEIHHAMFEAGGEYPSCSPFVCSGPRGGIGHATWEGRTVNAQEYVFLELAGCIQRYHTAMMRTCYVGEVTDNARQAAALVARAVEASIGAMKPGVSAQEVDRINREILADNPFGATQTTRSGYSIGIAYAPDWGEGGILSLKGDEPRLLEPNMVFHLIPWVQIPGEASIGLSETVRVTEDGCESLFDFERVLFSK
ncbi:MAG: M24 family metallopeptidase [Deltaproteobacteria bacterium]|jgi:Xaa-Pro dipeptidase